MVALAHRRRARREHVLARTKAWIDRARAGKITGVRIRDGEGEELDVPALLHLSRCTDIAVVETVPEAATYRTADVPLSLGLVPAR